MIGFYFFCFFFVWLVFVLFCCYHHQINIVLFPPLSPSLSVVEFKTWPSFKFFLWKQGWQGSTDNKGDRVGKKPQLNIFLNTVLWNSTIHGGSVFLVFVGSPPFNGLSISGTCICGYPPLLSTNPWGKQI